MIVKPRYTLLAGVVFIALAVVYGIAQPRLGRRDDARRPGDRDGADGLRARRGLAPRRRAVGGGRPDPMSLWDTLLEIIGSLALARTGAPWSS